MTRYLAIIQLVAHIVSLNHRGVIDARLRGYKIYSTKKAGEWRRDLFHHSQTMQSKYT